MSVNISIFLSKITIKIIFLVTMFVQTVGATRVCGTRLLEYRELGEIMTQEAVFAQIMGATWVKRHASYSSDNARVIS